MAEVVVKQHVEEESTLVESLKHWNWHSKDVHALAKAVESIARKSSSRTGSLVESGFSRQPGACAGPPPFLYVRELRKRWWLGIIPRTDRKALFTVWVEPTYAGRDVKCILFDKSILDIVKDEINRWVDTYGVKSVKITTA